MRRSPPSHRGAGDWLEHRCIADELVQQHVENQKRKEPLFEEKVIKKRAAEKTDDGRLKPERNVSQVECAAKNAPSSDVGRRAQSRIAPPEVGEQPDENSRADNAVLAQGLVKSIVQLALIQHAG